jgi:hypothetical protein
MVSELPTSDDGNPQVLVPDFGPLDSQYLDLSRSRQIRMYKITWDQLKSICSAINFTAHFEMPSIIVGYVDLYQSEGRVVLEIERNTRPTEISVRYARDKWIVLEALGKTAEGLRASIKTEYFARTIPDEALAAIGEQLSVSVDALKTFYIRINFKKKTVGLVAEESFIDSLPSGSFAQHVIAAQAPEPAVNDNDVIDDWVDTTEEEALSLPLPDVEPLPTSSPPQQENHPPAQASSPPPQPQVQQKSIANPVEEQPRKMNSTEGQAKYATYSRSEVDYMFKQQAESILSALSGKIAAQQRAFQDTVAAQEKTITKLTDTLIAQVEGARVKLEATSKTSHENTKAELEEFQRALAKELESYRTQINKSILPVSKALEDKSLKQPAKEPKQASSATALQAAQAANKQLKQLLIATLLISLISLAMSFITLSTVSGASKSATSQGETK